MSAELQLYRLNNLKHFRHEMLLQQILCNNKPPMQMLWIYVLIHTIQHPSNFQTVRVLWKPQKINLSFLWAKKNSSVLEMHFLASPMAF